MKILFLSFFLLISSLHATVSLTVAGNSYDYPETGDLNWGNDATEWAQAVSENALFKTGGTFVLTGEVNFGSTYGLVSEYYKSNTSDVASSGEIRLAKTDDINWRNNVNDADLTLTIGTDDLLEFNSIDLVDVSTSQTLSNKTLSNPTISGLTASRAIISNASGIIAVSDITSTEIGYLDDVSSNIQTQIDGKITTVLSDSNIIVGNASSVATAVNPAGDIEIANDGTTSIEAGVIVNADVNASAGIEYSKMEALDSNKALVTNAIGVASTVTSVSDTEVGYLDGVTSSIQTQLNTKLTDPLTTDGDILIYNSGSTRLAVGSSGQALTVGDSGLPEWGTGGLEEARFLAVNLIETNAGFEDGDTTGWTSGGTPTTFDDTSTAANVGRESYSLEFDASADGDYAETSALTVPQGYLSRNGVACIRYKGADENLELNILDGSSNELISEAFVASTGWTDKCVNFIFPSSGTVKLRLEAEGDAAVGYFDDAFIGDANRVNISQVSSAEVYGTAIWEGTSNCSWSNATNGSFSSFSGDSDCTYPTGSNLTGYAEAPDTKIPAIKFSNLPPGKYKVEAVGYFKTSKTSTDETLMVWRIYDGTNSGGAQTLLQAGSSGVTQKAGTPYISGTFEYDTAQTDVTFEIQSFPVISGDTGEIVANTADKYELKFSVYRYPLESQTAINPDTATRASGVKIAADASHDYTGTSATYEAVTDVDVIAGDKTHYGQAVITDTAGNFGFKMPVVNPGTYFVYFSGRIRTDYSSSNTTCSFAIYDGTSYAAQISEGTTPTATRVALPTGTGYFSYDSVQTDVEYIIYARRDLGAGSCTVNASNITYEMGIIPVGESVNLPQILNQVSSSSSGGVKVCSFSFTNSGTPTIATNDGCVDSLTDDGAGQTVVNFVSGHWASAPICTCTSMGDFRNGCVIDTAPTTASFLVYNANYSTGLADASQLFICVGDK